MGKVQLPPLPCWLPPILNIKQKTCSHSCVCKCRKGGGGGRILEDENQVGNGVVSLLEARKKRMISGPPEMLVSRKQNLQ